MSKTQLVEEILALKKQHNALLLSHFYEDGDIQDLADHVGDSLALAQWGEEAKNPVLVMNGVVFMAESAKILSPEKKVLIPDMNAGCSLVDHSPFDKYLAWRRAHPDGIAVTYVNSSAAVKAITDVTCTSSNAEKIINSIPKDRKILFGPDKNLGRYLAKKLNREMVLWPGACEVHVLFSARKLFELKKQYPNALVLAHPECNDVILDQADVIGATSRLLDEVVKNKSKTDFIVATEAGILHQMKKMRPEANLIPAPPEGSCACNECPYMKMNTLEKLRNALRDLKPEVTVDPEVAQLARVSLERMLKITRGETVKWPARFEFDRPAVL